MHQSLIIIDDVLEEAPQIREAALKMDYADPGPADYFPGRNSVQRLRIRALEALASELTRERLEPATDGYGKCRISLENEDGKGGVHVDQCHWSGIYYLSRPEDCRGGTDFFRHKQTNSEHAPYTRQHLHDWGFASYQDFVERVSKPHAKDDSQWERVMRVPMRFNRLILFRPWLWHTAGPGFGDRRETGRLVHLLFFNNPDHM